MEIRGKRHDGERNAAAGELLIRVPLTKVTARKELAD